VLRADAALVAQLKVVLRAFQRLLKPHQFVYEPFASTGWNNRAHPFVWTKTPEEILKKADRQTTSNAGH
jgi:hypothetical protein